MSHATTARHSSELHRLAPAQRVALARQRFFEEGLRPAGLVADVVLQSWSRCQAAQHNAAAAVVFDPVSASGLRQALAHNDDVLQAAQDELRRLQTTLSATPCSVLLTDAHAVVLHASLPRSGHYPLLQLAARHGVRLDEGTLGTNAPALVCQTKSAVSIHGSEHYYSALGQVHCAAAPIHDSTGALRAVLDVTSENGPFAFDIQSLVALHATAIENRLLQAQSRHDVLVQVHADPSFFDTPMQGLLALSEDGQVRWANAVAQNLLGLQGRPTRASFGGCSAVLGLEMSRLTHLATHTAWADVPTPGGLRVWLRPHLPAAHVAAHGSAQVAQRVPPTPLTQAATATPPAAAPAVWIDSASAPPLDATRAATLHEHDLQLIQRTVDAAGGNVSKAARQLGVSRGTIYRKLRQAHDESAQPSRSAQPR